MKDKIYCRLGLKCHYLFHRGGKQCSQRQFVSDSIVKESSQITAPDWVDGDIKVTVGQRKDSGSK